MLLWAYSTCTPLIQRHTYCSISVALFVLAVKNLEVFCLILQLLLRISKKDGESRRRIQKQGKDFLVVLGSLEERSEF